MKRLVLIIMVFGLMSLSLNTFACEGNKEVKGQVKDLKCKSPVSGAGIIVKDSEKLIGTISDENGNFNLIGVAEGKHELQIKRSGYKDVFVPITVRSGRGLALEFELEQEQVNNESDKASKESESIIPNRFSFISLIPTTLIFNILYYFISF